MDDITASIIVTCQTEGAAASVSKLGYAFAQLARKGVEFGVQSIKAFSDMQEETNKFNVVFQGAGRKSKKVVDELIAGYGASEFSAKKMLSATGDLLTGLGVERDVSLELAEATAKLGSDLASFSNYAGGAEGAAMALTKGMLGERESMKMLGIVIREDDEAYKALQKQAMTTGVTIDALGKTFKVSSEQQAKAVATIALAYKQSPNAIGDFKRSQDSIANSGRILANRFLDLKIAVGEFIDSFAHVGGINSSIAESMKTLTDRIKKNRTEWTMMIKTVFIEMEFALKRVGQALSPLINAFGTLFARIRGIGTLLVKANPADVLKALGKDWWDVGTVWGWGKQIGTSLREKYDWNKVLKQYGGEQGVILENLRRAEAGIPSLEEEFKPGADIGNNLNELAKKFNVEMPSFKEFKWDLDFTKLEAERLKALADMEKRLRESVLKGGDTEKKETASPAAEAKKLVELGKSTAIGSFSAAELNQRIGTTSPAQKTADNTKKMVSTTQHIANQLDTIATKALQPIAYA